MKDGWSKHNFLEAIEHLIDANQQDTQTPWISRQQLCQHFQQRYQTDPEAIAHQLTRHPKGLRYLLVKGDRFAIYGTSQPGEYYVARRDKGVPNRLKSGHPKPKQRPNGKVNERPNVSRSSQTTHRRKATASNALNHLKAMLASLDTQP
ncbi:MAG: hypothetical protein EA367_20470 [Leptolyngbya sp. DLM2.Bin15]|nr:MAG: hypothetical protein EA367_20470 [Leptolyngbya sp. DLM2.Bin15]